MNTIETIGSDELLCQICETAKSTHALTMTSSDNEDDEVLVCYPCLIRRTVTAKERSLLAKRKA